MTYEELIKSFTEPEMAKTAAAPEPTSENELRKSLDAVVEKTAAPTAPAGDVDALGLLEKMAAELAGTEKNAELEHAAMLGRALADGAINQWESYRLGLKKAASDVAVQEAIKTAAMNGYSDAVAVLQQNAQPAPKVAEATEQDVGELLKQAAAAGDPEAAMKLAEYNAGVQAAIQDLQEYPRTGVLKTAAQMEYEAGQYAALEELHKQASVEFLRGAAETEILVNAMAQNG